RRVLLTRPRGLTGMGRRDSLIGLRMRWLGRLRRLAGMLRLGLVRLWMRRLARTRGLDGLIGLGRLARTLLVGMRRLTRLRRGAGVRRELRRVGLGARRLCVRLG